MCEPDPRRRLTDLNPTLVADYDHPEIDRVTFEARQATTPRVSRSIRFGLRWENPRAYDDASVITDVADIETPFLLTAGENDLRCPPEQAE